MCNQKFRAVGLGKICGWPGAERQQARGLEVDGFEMFWRLGGWAGGGARRGVRMTAKGLPWAAVSAKMENWREAELRRGQKPKCRLA